jgi:C-terminal processing protease CtpA/Prc
MPEKSWIEEIGVVAVGDGPGEILNLTLSGYDEGRPRWSADGTALLFYSNRFGRRNHGSWGANGDVFAIDLTQAAYDRALLSQEELELLEGKKDDEKGQGEPSVGGGQGKRRRKKEKKPVQPVRIEADGCEERLRRLTVHSAQVGGFALSPDGETLVYFAQVKGQWKLWAATPRKSEVRQLIDVDGDGEVVYNEEGNAVFARTEKGKIVKVPVGKGGRGGRGGGRGGGAGGGGGGGDVERVGYAAEMTIDGPAERAYIFEHAWRQARAKFYEPDLHGADWAALKKNYERFLGDIDNNHDFAELLSEMLGELNASHTGAGYRIPQEGKDETAALGLLFDPAHAGPGLRVVEVLDRGPCDKADNGIVYGTVLTHIDGVALAADTNAAVLLNRKAGKPTRLAFRAPDGKTFERVVKPVKPRAESNLRYRRWVRQRRALTDELSKGRVGYVHVRGMNDSSFRNVFQEALGRYADREALVVDTRFNGGGWLHDDLVKFLGGKRYGLFHPRGKQRGALGGEPLHRWARPSVVIQNEANYSDAHIFPWAYHTLGIGKLVGTPVAGTGTAVWWERQIDPTLVFGIPQVGFVDMQGRYLENQELKPDILVYNDANARQAGKDPQLEAAVAELMKQLGDR